MVDNIRMINKINEFDFNSDKCVPTNTTLESQARAQLENKEVQLLGLRHFCFSCRLCPLGCSLIEEKGKKFDPHVFSNMNHKAEFVVVGQNPGFDECMEGTPFVGAAGRNFDAEIEKHKISRRHFYITNVVKCHTVKNSKPDRKYVDVCSKLLELELMIIKPKLIITLGASSFDYLCPNIAYSSGLGNINNSIYDIPVFAAYHPSPLNISEASRREEFNRQISLMCKLIKAVKKEDYFAI